MDRKLRIALVTGHREGSQGAVGSENISEWTFWQEFISELVPLLSDKHEYQRFLRKDKMGGYTNEISDLHKRIDGWGADVSVSFHFNAAADESVHGNETLYCSNGGKYIAIQINDILISKLDNNHRGVKKLVKSDNGGGFVCKGRSKAIIVEPFFAPNQHLYVNGGEYRQNLIDSFVQFFYELHLMP